MDAIAWSAMPTFTSGNVLTAAQLTILTGNLAETAAAKATTAGRYFATTGANTLAQRIPTASYIGTTETTTATSFGNLATAGPDANFVSGPVAQVILTAGMFNNTVNAECFYGVAGVAPNATIFAASSNESLRMTSSTANAQLVGTWAYNMALTSGTQGLRARYQVSSGTGTFFDRRISVVPW